MISALSGSGVGERCSSLGSSLPNVRRSSRVTAETAARLSGYSGTAESPLALPGLELLLDVGHKLVGQRAVDQAVIERQRQHDDRANGDGIVDDNGALLDTTHSHDGDLGLIDDWRSRQCSINTGIRNSKRSILHIIRCQFLCSCPLSQIIDGVSKALQ